ncbi:hypothetical protein HFN89_05155 [Rhizobium laguerreae]|nr:hypothetical protein [Rhizobium laguerreae]
MSVGSEFANGLDFVRISLGGAMIGGSGSNVLGASTSLGTSMKRDLICATLGFALFLWILVGESRRDKRAQVDKSVDNTPALPAEKH